MGARTGNAFAFLGTVAIHCVILSVWLGRGQPPLTVTGANDSGGQLASLGSLEPGNKHTAGRKSLLGTHYQAHILLVNRKAQR